MVWRVRYNIVASGFRSEASNQVMVRVLELFASTCSLDDNYGDIMATKIPLTKIPLSATKIPL
jgi:hypothetical protein